MPEATSPDEVLVRAIATGIWGSDLRVDDWTPSYAFITQALSTFYTPGAKAHADYPTLAA